MSLGMTKIEIQQAALGIANSPAEQVIQQSAKAKYGEGELQLPALPMKDHYAKSNTAEAAKEDAGKAKETLGKAAEGAKNLLSKAWSTIKSHPKTSAAVAVVAAAAGGFGIYKAVEAKNAQKAE